MPELHSRGFEATRVVAVADIYQFEISGTIGPMVACGLPGLSTIAESSWTVLTGTAAGPDELRRLLDRLDAHGTPALAIRISYRHDNSATSSGGGNV